MALIAVVAILCGLADSWLAFRPSSLLLTSSAQIGATLLIAYAIEVSWFIKSSRPTKSREDWIGFGMGIGAAGLIGVTVALGLSERVMAHHWTWIDELLFGWVAGSLAMLGSLIVGLPELASNWSKAVERELLD